MEALNPQYYHLHLEPDLTTFEFTGKTKILIEVVNPTDTVILNAYQITVIDCRIENGNKTKDIPFSYDEKNKTITIKSPEKFSSSFTLFIDYKGIINNELAGFYRSRYTDRDNNEKFIAVTQFEQSDAQRAFPCFDHPARKAYFDIEFVIDQNLSAIANTEIIQEKNITSQKKLVKFAKTPYMSTYLLFFGIGNFEFIEHNNSTINVRVVTVPGKTRFARFGLEFGKKALQFGEEYTGIKFPITKCDFIAIPDFAFGAMENYGAITFRENRLLTYPGSTSSLDLEAIGEVIAHEVAHMWFGNLVSPLEWKYIWLNESFATLFGIMITDHFFPDWGIWDRYISEFKHTALNRDSLNETFPIELTTENADNDLSVATSDIIYTKGASILLMMKGYLGDDTFKTGVNHFLSKHKFSNASSKDYWIAFDEVLDGPIVDMTKSWVHQPGYPIVRVKKDGNTLHFSQERFTFLPNENNQLWKIPLTIVLYDHHGNSDTVKTLMLKKSMYIKIPRTTRSFIVNPGQTGFYRVEYERDNLEETGPLITKKILASNDRYGIQNDIFALVKCGEYSFDRYLDFLNYYEFEDSNAPLDGICNNLLEAFLVLDSKRDLIRSIGTKILRQCLLKIKMDPQEGESHSTQILRNKLLWMASYFGDRSVTSFCLKQFKNYTAGQPVDANILESVLKTGASQDSGCYDFLINKFESPDTEETEKVTILRALGCFKDKDVVFRALEYTVDKVPLKNKPIPVISAAANTVITNDLWQWFIDNIHKIEKFHPFHFQMILSHLVPVSGLKKQGEITQFFEEYIKENGDHTDTVKMTLEKLDVYCNLRKNNGMF